MTASRCLLLVTFFICHYSLTLASVQDGSQHNTIDTVLYRHTKQAIVNLRNSSRQAISHLSNSSRQAIVNLSNTSRQAIANLSNSSRNAISNLRNSSRQIIISMGNSSWQFIVNVTNSSRQAILKFTNSSRQAILKLTNSSKQAIGKLTNSSCRAISKFTNSSRQTIGKFTNSSRQTIGKFTNSSRQAIGKFTNSSRQAIGKFTNSSRQTIGKFTNSSKQAIVNLSNSSRQAIINFGNSSKQAIIKLENSSSHAMSNLGNSSRRAIGKMGNSTAEVWISFKHLLQERVGEPLEKNVIRRLAKGVYAAGNFINKTKRKGKRILPHVEAPRIACENFTCDVCTYASVPPFDFDGDVCLRLQFILETLNVMLQLVVKGTPVTELNYSLKNTANLMLTLGKWYDVFFKTQFHDILVKNNTFYTCISLQMKFPFSSFLYLDAGCYYFGAKGIGTWNCLAEDSEVRIKQLVEGNKNRTNSQQETQREYVDKDSSATENKVYKVSPNPMGQTEMEATEINGDQNPSKYQLDLPPSTSNMESEEQGETRYKREINNGMANNIYSWNSRLYEINKYDQDELLNNSNDRDNNDMLYRITRYINETESKEEDEFKSEEIDAKNNLNNEFVKYLADQEREIIKEHRDLQLLGILEAEMRALVCDDVLVYAKCSNSITKFADDLESLLRTNEPYKQLARSVRETVSDGKLLELMVRIFDVLTDRDWDYLVKKYGYIL